jgi:hypothetical protein
MQTTAVFAWEGNEADAPFPLRQRLDALEPPKCFKNSRGAGSRPAALFGTSKAAPSPSDALFKNDPSSATSEIISEYRVISPRSMSSAEITSHSPISQD